MKNLLIILGLSLLFLGSAAQVPQTRYELPANSPVWMQLMYSEEPNARDVREAYEAYYLENEFVKNQHTQYYKRWMRANLHRTDASGTLIEKNYDAYEQEWQLQYSANSSSTTWQELGPWQYDHEAALQFLVQSPGAAHIYTVEQAPSNDQVVYAGSATAGMWKSTDKGMNWNLMTRDMLINSVYAIAVDPTDPDIVYFEGSGNIWKSVDGGLTSIATGDAAFQSLSLWTRDLKVVPGSPSTLLAATNGGLFRSVDAGTNWTLIQSGEFMEIEFKPGDPTTVYTVKLNGTATEFYRSTNTGVSFTQIISGWPAPVAGDENKRCEISVTAANPDHIYVLASGYADGYGGLYGIYISTDAGLTFTFQCCGTGPGGAPLPVTNPNILGWSGDGSGDGGQYYYDLALGVSPTDADKLFAAGISVWRSEDAGVNWDLNAHWVTWAGTNTLDRYTHADVHDVKFFDNGSGWDMWVASDGGLFYSSDEGDNVEPRMYGIQGTDFWGFQAGFQDGDVMLGGTYHNGTLIKYKDIYHYGATSETEGGWLAEGAGDNIRGFVNYGDNKIAYDDGGSFEFSEDRLVRPANRAFDGNYNCSTFYWTGEYGNFGWNPHNYNEFYSPVGNELYLTKDGGLSWDFVYAFTGEKIIQVAVAPSNPDVIYVTEAIGYWDHTIWRSDDGGLTWADANPSSAECGGNQWRHKYVTIDPTNENLLWCILIGNQSGYKVFRSANGGLNWVNYTGNSTIVNEEMLSIVLQHGTSGGLYVGTRHGVFYRDAAMSDWQLHGTELPASTSCAFLQPFYGEEKIRVATNRGVFECDFDGPSDPRAVISVDRSELNIGSSCLDQHIQFVDHSVLKVNGNTTWDWSFEGATPATSNERNPLVLYSDAGTWDVTLTVTDDNGTHTVTMTDFITITDDKEPFPVIEDFETTFPPDKWTLYNPGTSGWEWDWVPEDETNNRAASYPNYWVDATGLTTQMILPAMDFTDVVDPIFSFDYTHVTYGGYIDGLAVKYRTDGEPNWVTLWEIYDPALNVPGTDIWWWYNAGSTVTWQNQQISLSALAGETCVEFAIENIGGYGNHTWVDNISITTKPKAQFTTASLEVCMDEDEVLLIDQSLHNPTNFIWNIFPTTFSYQNGDDANTQSPTLIFEAAGTYSVTLTVYNQYGSNTLPMANYITVNECSCEEDLNFDGMIDIQDFLMLLGAYGCASPQPGCVGDFDDDGTVTVLDVLHMLTVYGNACP